jgi:hypothetical protein
MVTQITKNYIKSNIPYFGKLVALRYTGIKGKAWRLISDFVRMRDFLKYGKCITCNQRINDWREIDAGHFISMSGHGALSGFSDENIHGQCKGDNMLSSYHQGKVFEQNIISRGYDVDKIKKLANISVKADDWFFIKIIEITYNKFQKLKEEYPNENYPEYL